MGLSATEISRADNLYPPCLTVRLGSQAPERIAALGNASSLSIPKTAFFCSTRCPGDAILAAYDQAAQWRDEGCCIISGFHSPIEKECLRILLRGKQPIIICPARSLDGMRIPREWREPLEQCRLLLLSCFAKQHRRATADLARERNEFVAALADEIYAAHVNPGSNTEQLLTGAREWGIPIRLRPGIEWEDHENHSGAQPPLIGL